MPKPEVVLAAPAGFCAGVEAATKSLAWLVALNPPPVVCVHAVVHNEEVVARFEALGVRFIDRPEEAPRGAAVLLSAHGSAPDVVTRVHEARVVVDAACPLVSKVHREMRARSRAGDTILYVGRRGHDETEGTLAHSTTPVHVVASADDIDELPVDTDRPVSVLAQTTIPVAAWEAVAGRVRTRFAATWTARRDDVCFATTNRQAAVQQLAGHCDAVVIVGSATSSNTAALVQTALAAGAREVSRVNGVDDLRPPASDRVGVAAGTSTPRSSVDAVVRALDPRTVSTLRVVDEDEYFPLATGVRRQIEIAIDARALEPELVEAYRNDRTITAEDLLALVERVSDARHPRPVVVP